MFHNFFIRISVLCPLLLLATICVFAGIGDLDPSFGNGGKVVTSFDNRHSDAYAMAIQSDGKIVVAGQSAIVRYNKDGSLDASFGNGGKVATPSGTIFYAVAIQPDGKIVIAGRIVTSNADFVLIRYNKDSSLDTSFGTGGIVITPISSLADIAYAVAIQPDGRIVAAGSSGPFPSVDFALARYNPDGSLDNSFGTGGKVITNINNSANIAYAMALQPDGKVVAAGFSGDSNRDFALARYNTDGTLDNSFGTGGSVTTSIGSGNDEAYAVAIQSDGRIVAAGYSFERRFDFALARYNTDGLLDTSFATGGKAITSFGRSGGFAYAMAVQSNGKIIVAGRTTYNNGAYSEFALVRYNPNGSLDSSFGRGGKVTTVIGNGSSVVRAVAIQPDGKIVAAGTIYYSQGDGLLGSDFALARYLGDPTKLRSTQFDFDGDGKSDISVWRPSNGFWHIMKSSGGFSSIQWGQKNDALVPGDYDGDGTTDLAVYRRGVLSGPGDVNIWYIRRSSDDTFLSRRLGRNGFFEFDVPMPADYDGDGKTDLAVNDISDAIGGRGSFRILQSSTDLGVDRQWGFNNDKRVPADYDGDGKVDLAVFRFQTFPDNTGFNTWFILQSSNGVMRVERFGLPTDRLVPADYDGDGKADIAVYRPSNGFWYILQSRDGFRAEQFGVSTDKPTPADYDGDGKTDIAVFRPSNGTWYLQRSTEGFAAYVFGFGDDIPIPNVYVR